ncbi:MAG: thiamine pyrophosphate-binding protein [Deltaproteobacteria bacterium]|nr:thiamine pyrophosphate-binding protein [Deltaproteobacteria bacterium]MBW1961099.1 thiamine pyrophosphate-binding protein [Deltaproteobacteria bacterium]MBW2150483.1 thiamine pyrophosphate-binding protein [Deltaproteobacteria bacterium]
MPKAVDVIAEVLKQEGIDRIFGIPGSGATTDLIRAAGRVGIETILVGHESAAALIASVYGEIKEVPGVCFAITGPGATNLVSGVAYAHLERAALLAIVEKHIFKNYESIYSQRIDQAPLFAPITKGQFLLSANSAQQITEKALRLAKEEKPGPVLLELAKDEANETATYQTRHFRKTIRFSNLTPKYSPSVEEAEKRIRTAKFPVLVAGIGAKRDKATPELALLAEKLKAPVMITPKGRGVFDETNRLYGGIFLGTFSKGTFEDAIIGKADLLIMIGVDPIELLPKPWKLKLPVIHIGRLPNMENVYCTDMEIVGEITTVLKSLCEGTLQTTAWNTGFIDDFHNQVMTALSFSRDPLPLHRIIEITRDKLPPDGILTTDIGAFNSMVNYLWKVSCPGTYFGTKGLSTMGFALPAAIAAQLALPDKRVVCFIGDGSFLMCMHELALCSRLNLPIIVVVFSDGELGLIKIKQQNAGLDPVGVTLSNPHFPLIARAFEGVGLRTETEEEFAHAMNQALEDNQLYLIEAVLNPQTYGEHIRLMRG